VAGLFLEAPSVNTFILLKPFQSEILPKSISAHASQWKKLSTIFISITRCGGILYSMSSQSDNCKRITEFNLFILS
jgi:hypothetical protein